ncbi:uncharacterized protein BDW43DRAFT_316732 [Aspergillus alliaceus]|uniref:uncharacterized protein n=1 Tax=Petromyces alliaceus TaxID=209559 RepID=UPI0012A72C11|nr:uncharacterized protein BDW43DRAFT_316732 [Aspergillus alliaceus]KAB8227559.1 hypothetical protein BDW43DRAFT_316732 [Aspergillus alliaceus]
MSFAPQELFQSMPLHFVVGPEHTRFSIHSAILERFPDALRRELHDLQTEQHGRMISLEHMDAMIFACCCQYAYTGRYTAPQLKPQSSSELGNPAACTQESHPFDGPFAVVIPPYQPQRSSSLHMTTLCGHSRVYHFARKYHWESLQSYAAKEFHATMWRNDFSLIHVEELVQLLRTIVSSSSETPNYGSDLIVEHLVQRLIS